MEGRVLEGNSQELRWEWLCSMAPTQEYQEEQSKGKEDLQMWQRGEVEGRAKQSEGERERGKANMKE